MLITWATADKVQVLQRAVDIETLTGSLSSLQVSLEGRFMFEGDAPDYTMVFNMPEEQADARFSFETGWPIWWSRWGRLLHYTGQHSSVKAVVRHRGVTHDTNGLGVMEHVCGISLPFDFTRFLSLHYHWDVLAFHPSHSPFDSAAGLSIGKRGETLLQLRAAAKLPGRDPEAMRGLSVRYLEVSNGEDAEGNPFMIPVRWEGVLRGRKDVLRYQAASRTPVAELIPSGGMLGFDFEGEWTSPGEGIKTCKGTGFSEYGDFSGRLAGLARCDALKG
jgi:hypothetical protein